MVRFYKMFDKWLAMLVMSHMTKRIYVTGFLPPVTWVPITAQRKLAVVLKSLLHRLGGLNEF